MNIGSPEAVGFSSQKLNRLVPLMQEYVDTNKVPGLILMIARRGKIAFAETCGVRDITNNEAMPLDGIFRLASQTKPITAAAALILYEEGAFQIDDPVAKYLPEFSQTKVYAGVANGRIQLADMEQPITIEDLFTHQSGIVPTSGAYPIGTDLEALYSQADLKPQLRVVCSISFGEMSGRGYRHVVCVTSLQHAGSVVRMNYAPTR